ncbi:MAG: hypothetical protein IPK79_05705 [Vampirovibrionales bacterium]|nr:hypothetical protein [Vampirovibrionales bacterium]
MRTNRWMSVADPIHGIIQFDRDDETHRLLLDVMNTRAFQRLRRLKQMGLAEFVFPNAVHNRFVHSLGATHLMVLTLQHFRREPETRDLLKNAFADTDIALGRLLLLGILTHDIGHGPLSHTLEDILGLKERGLGHDDYWNAKILREDDELGVIWQRYGAQLPDAVIRLTGEGAHTHFLASLISSQLDMDRLDYLLRDSHFLGVRYGQIESQRIIGNLTLAQTPGGQPTLAVREEALPAVEHYLFGRHEAYKMALHSLDKSSEATLKKTLERFRWARDRDIAVGPPAQSLYQLMNDPQALSVPQYLRLDDYGVWDAIHGWSLEADDALLRQLATRLMKHDIFKFVDLRAYGLSGPLRETMPAVYDALQAHYVKRGLSMTFGFDELQVRPRPLYLRAPDREPIWILTQQGAVDLGDASSLPLGADAHRGEKHLAFVWDREAREFLKRQLQSLASPSRASKAE